MAALLQVEKTWEGPTLTFFQTLYKTLNPVDVRQWPNYKHRDIFPGPIEMNSPTIGSVRAHISLFLTCNEACWMY